MTSQMNWYYDFGALLANHGFIMTYLKVVRSDKMDSHLDIHILYMCKHILCLHVYTHYDLMHSTIFKV